jgi:hypothetical protein
VSVVVSALLSTSATDTPAIASVDVLVDALRAWHGVDRRVVHRVDGDRTVSVSLSEAVGGG